MKKRIEITVEQQARFDAAIERIKVATGARTQVQLADVLMVRQSSISDAKRRASIPPEWLLKLFRAYKLMPDWLMDGDGPKLLTDLVPEMNMHVARQVDGLRDRLQHVAETVMNALDALAVSKAEIEKRREAALYSLEECSKDLKGMRAELDGLPPLEG